MTKLRGELKKNHPLAKYTSWHIGGPAKIFYQPADLEDLSVFLKIHTGEYTDSPLPIIFLGFGSNVLIRDKGIDGIVIHTKNLNRTKKTSHTIYAETGIPLTRLPFLPGIPGSVGGALAMNAGAFGEEIWDYVIEVKTINQNGDIQTKTPTDFTINYRQVIMPPNEWFISAKFILKKFKKNNAMKKRIAIQPINEKTCGSVFRNPPGDYAARLIESCGLKGKQIGDVQVSQKHANFIINKNNATATDVENLINYVTTEVHRKTGVKLTLEVKIL
jgi:UDP-N-acetylmuramate dehydrogenase